MFVRREKYKKLVAEHEILEGAALGLAKKLVAAERQLETMAAIGTQFTEEELRTLIGLVHPDRHGGKESAVRMTQKINQLRGK